MDNEAPPPAYEAHTTDVLPSSSTASTSRAVPSTREPAPPPFEKRYWVNGVPLSEPFISPDDLQTHLNLLAAFKSLRRRVESSKELNQVRMGAQGQTFGNLTPEQRWRAYVAIAMDRFVAFLGQNDAEIGGEIGLEVLLVWYAHLLHPGRDYSIHPFAALDGVNPFPPEILDHFRRAATSKQEAPSKGTGGGLRLSTADPLAIICESERLVFNPRPEEVHTMLWIAGGSGYVESGSVIKVEGDARRGTHSGYETLGMARLVRDLVRWRMNPALFPRGMLNIPEAHDWLFGRQGFRKSPLKDLTEHEMGELFNWSKAGYVEFLRKMFAKEPFVGGGVWSNKGKIRELSQIADHYSWDEDLAFDLRTILDGPWLEEPLRLGWDVRADFECLEIAVTRYHAACDLVAGGFAGGVRSWSAVAPTVDIELARRTHELLNRADQDFARHVSAFRSGSTKSQETWVQTRVAWEDRFGAPYALNSAPKADSRSWKQDESAKKGYDPADLVYTEVLPPNVYFDGRAMYSLNWRSLPGSPDTTTFSTASASASTSGTEKTGWMFAATGRP